MHLNSSTCFETKFNPKYTLVELQSPIIQRPKPAKEREWSEDQETSKLISQSEEVCVLGVMKSIHISLILCIYGIALHIPSASDRTAHSSSYTKILKNAWNLSIWIGEDVK